MVVFALRDPRTTEGTLSSPPPVRRFTVDGEVFDVHFHRDGQAFSADWVSGRNPGYGFSSGFFVTPESAPSGPDAFLTDDEVVARIRRFLQLIDPSTGYVAD